MKSLSNVRLPRFGRSVDETTLKRASARGPRQPRVPRTVTLPLGIDIGAHRLRAALVQRAPDGRLVLQGVATRDIPGGETEVDEASALLAAMIAELGAAERRCVLAVGPSDALVRRVAFPSMSRSERERAARFEAARFIDFPIDDAHVRVASPEDAASGRHLVGVVRRAAMQQALAIAKGAKLRPVALDHQAFAWRRAVPHDDAVLDIGATSARLHVFGDDLPHSETFTFGGDELTDAIARSLGIDRDTAERRKRSLGFAGAGDAARDRLVETLASVFIELRSSGFADIRSLVLAGNGARIVGIAHDIERVTGLRTRFAEIPSTVTSPLPSDVTRAAGPDWALAIGLALHTAPRASAS